MKTVLVIEDDIDTNDAISTILEDMGYIVTKSYVRMPVSRIVKIKPDLVIVNFWMPEGYGSEICDSLKADNRTKSIPIILLSSVSDSILIDKCKADKVMYKPFDLNEIIEVVKKHLAKPRLHS